MPVDTRGLKPLEFPFVTFFEVQVRKGDQRRSLSIVDLGDVRIALDVDLTEYQ